jgi:hypothetical protein
MDAGDEFRISTRPTTTDAPWISIGQAVRETLGGLERRRNAGMSSASISPKGAEPEGPAKFWEEETPREEMTADAGKGTGEATAADPAVTGVPTDGAWGQVSVLSSA